MHRGCLPVRKQPAHRDWVGGVGGADTGQRMKPVEQTIPTAPRGDCFRACIASILELPIEWCPNPHDPEEHWWDAWNTWLRDRGFELVEWDVGTKGVYANLSGYWIATVPSLNSSASADTNLGRHCIVMYGNKIAHDPSLGKKRTDRDWKESDQFFAATLLVPLDPSSPTGKESIQVEK